jgi:pimeloyl-ACP methyl ester carboxylesterase
MKSSTSFQADTLSYVRGCPKLSRFYRDEGSQGREAFSNNLVAAIRAVLFFTLTSVCNGPVTNVTIIVVVENFLIKVGNLDVNYYSAGRGNPLIIVHGGGGGSATWTESAAKLSAHYLVYYPDLPGYGRSQTRSDDFSMADYVQFISDFSHTLGLKHFNLMGHSIGGAIAVEYAMKHPEKVRRLILVDSLGLSHKVGLWVRLLSTSFLIDSVGRYGLPLIKGLKWLVKSLFKTVLFDPLPPVKMDIGRYIAALKDKTGFSARLTALSMPTLLVWGARDTIVPVSNAYAAAAIIPDCQVRVFEGAWHNPYRQREDEFCTAVIQFLGQ